jgi:UDP-glucose 4-epimerase
MKVLITGGAGYIGSNLAALLACTREKPIVLDLRKPRIPGVIYVQGDVQRLGFPDSPLEHTSEVRGVVHLAALTGKKECYQHTHKAFDTNVVGTQQVLEFCRQRDITQMVFASTCGIYCDTGENFYIVTKKQAETHCREYAERHGLNIVILRIANVYGGAFGYKDKLTVVHQFILKALLGEALKIEGDGKQTRDFIHVRDVCSAILRGLGLRSPGTFFAGTGVETSMSELALLIERTMLKLYDRTITIEYVPMPCYRFGEGVKVEITHSPVPGWQPNYDLEKGVEKTCLIASQAR